jgi:hypothetical protein
MYNRSTTSIFCLILLSTLVNIDTPVIGIQTSQLSNLDNSVQAPTLLSRVVHDSDDNSAPKEGKT